MTKNGWVIVLRSWCKRRCFSPFFITPLPQMTPEMKTTLQYISFTTLGTILTWKMAELFTFEVAVKNIQADAWTNKCEALFNIRLEDPGPYGPWTSRTCSGPVVYLLGLEKNVGATFFWSKWGFCPTENGEKLQKYGQNYPKWPKNGPNNGHFFHLGTHIIFEKPILTPNLSSFGHKMAKLS